MANEQLRPCAGVNVVDLGQGMAGAMPGMILADNGASVVKVEPPQGDWARDTPGFLMWNRNKRSVVLDLDDEKGRRNLRALIRRADVVIDAYRPGVAAALGLDPGALRAENPRLIHCSISGFGPATAYADVAGYEALVSAVIGRMEGLDHLNGAVKGQDRAAPIFTAAPVASYGAAQLAVQGILAALVARDRTGRGARLETSLVQGAAAFLMRQELPRHAGKGAPLVSAATHAGIELCFMTARCSDGRFLQMCARQDAQFRNWLRAIGLEGVLDEPVYARAPMGIARLEDVAELDRRIRERMATKTQAEWMDLFTTTFDVGCDPFLTPAEFLSHPQMVENGRVVEFDDPSVGRCRQVGPMVVIEDQVFPTPKPAPLLGEHTSEVLAELSDEAPEPETPVLGGAETGRRPLEGITVVELAYFIAGPLAGALLAELGARVIKVEPLDGDPYRRTGLQSAKFLHGKESIALDLKAPEGQAILHQLVAGADIFVHSFRPGVPERLGVDYATLSGLNPSLVYLYAASYGSKGSQAKRTAFHSTPNALSGAGIIQAGVGNPPVDDSFPDPGSALGVATSLLLGLRARSATGRSQRLETTMLASTGYIMSPWLVDYPGAPPPAVADTGQHGLGALYRLYRTGDGWLFLACVQPAEWSALTEVLGREWADDARFATKQARRQNDHELAAAIAEILATKNSAEWVERLGAEGVPAVVASTSPQEGWWEAQGLLSEASHPIFGDYWRPPAKVDIEGVPPRRAPAAAVGEHSRALLAELGYEPAKVDELISAGVVGEWSAPSED